MTPEKKLKLCPFLPPMPVKTALSGPQLSYMPCQGELCEIYDEAAHACGMKTKVNVDLGNRQLYTGDKK